MGTWFSVGFLTRLVCIAPLLRMQCIDKNINGKSYDEKQVQGWINAVCEDVMQGLSELKKPFKYIGALRRWNRRCELHARPHALTVTPPRMDHAPLAASSHRHQSHALSCRTREQEYTRSMQAGVTQ